MVPKEDEAAIIEISGKEQCVDLKQAQLRFWKGISISEKDCLGCRKMSMKIESIEERKIQSNQVLYKVI